MRIGIERNGAAQRRRSLPAGPRPFSGICGAPQRAGGSGGEPCGARRDVLALRAATLVHLLLGVRSGNLSASGNLNPDQRVAAPKSNRLVAWHFCLLLTVCRT